MPNVGSQRAAGLLPSFLIATQGASNRPRLYLTFDDGPHESVTDELRELLAEHSVTASFFCIGENLRNHPDVARRLLAAGHAVCNHSDTHPNYRRLALSAQLADATACQTEVQQLGGPHGKIFRAPQGQLSARSLMSMRLRGWKLVHWSYDSLDYQKPPLEQHLSRFEQQPIRNGDVVLFHDDNSLCVEALRVLLPRWKAEGFSFGLVTELQ